MLAPSSRAALRGRRRERDHAEPRREVELLDELPVVHRLLRGPLVDEELDAVAEGPRLPEPQPLGLAGAAEEPLARADDHRIDEQVEGIDEVVLDQRLGKLRAAVNEDVPLVPLLEAPYLLDDIAAENRRVRPLGILQRGRDDVLRHRVEVVGELALEIRPARGEPLVGDPPEQLRGGGHRLVDLELIAFRTAGEAVSPADPLERLRAARRLDNTIHRHVLGHDDPSHYRSPLARVQWCQFRPIPAPDLIVWLDNVLLRERSVGENE